MGTDMLRNPEHVQNLRDISIQARTLRRDRLPEGLTGALVHFAARIVVTGQTLVIDGGAYFH